LPCTASARPAEVHYGEDGTPKSDARTHRTPKALRAKIHAKRLAGFREALGVRTRSRVAFNPHAALNSICKLTVPPPALKNGVGRFPKKEEFRLVLVFQVSSNVFKN
jgi:hypothetical protein